MRKLAALLLLLLTAAPLPVHCEPRAVELRAGNAERKVIVAALRVPMGRKLGKPLIFKVDHLRSTGTWAFLIGAPRNPDGSKIDYRGTPWAEAVKAGAFDDWCCGLLKKRGGKWTVVDWQLGATDVAWVGWDKQYGAPKSVFPPQ